MLTGSEEIEVRPEATLLIRRIIFILAQLQTSNGNQILSTENQQRKQKTETPEANGNRDSYGAEEQEEGRGDSTPRREGENVKSETSPPPSLRPSSATSSQNRTEPKKDNTTAHPKPPSLSPIIETLNVSLLLVFFLLLPHCKM